MTPTPAAVRLDITTVQSIQLAADQLHGGEKVAIVVTVAPDDELAVLVMTRGLAEVLAHRLTHGEQLTHPADY